MSRCPKCWKLRTACECVDICRRCWSVKCTCGMTDVDVLHNDDHKFEMDEDVADEFARNSQEERTPAYWHGYNTVRKFGPKNKYKCKYTGQERRDFYRGISDARYKFS